MCSTVRGVLVLALLLAACEDPAAGAAPAPRPPAAPAAQAVEPTWIEVDAGSLGGVLRDRPEPALLVNMWSTWCRPCLHEMPGLVAAARRYQSRGLGAVFISVDAPDQREAALEVLRQHHIPLPGYIKTGPDGPFIEALHDEWSGALPATLLLDRNRDVVHFWEEEVDGDMLAGPVEQVLASRTEPTEP